MSPLSFRALTLGSVLLLSGCATLHNDASRDIVLDRALESAWTDRTLATQIVSSSEADFWDGFNDPMLTDLITEAVSNNPSIDAARARIQEARAVIGVIESGNRLQLSTNTSAGTERLSEEGPGPQGQVPGLDLEESFFGLGGVAAWEPDIWGRNSLLVESNEFNVKSAEAAAEAVALSLKADTARLYIRLRAAEAQLDVIDRTLRSLERSRALIDLLVQAGDAPEFDRLQVEARLEATQAQRLQQDSKIKLLRHGLATLLGKVPSALEGQLPASGDIPDYSGGIAAGLPSDLVYRRPDVEQARFALLAAAKSEESVSLNHLPSFSLTGDGGLLSTGFNSLISTDARRGVISAAMNWPILSGGRLSAERGIADAQTQAAQATYDLALLQGLNDVESAFERYAASGETLVRINTLIDRQDRILSLSEARYQAGEDSLFRSLEAQIDALAAREQRLNLLAARSLSAVDIYTALGGYI